jgi:hypothetical protein
MPAKSSLPSTHPIRGDELRILRRLQREEPASGVRICERAWGPVFTGRLQLDGKASWSKNRASISG